MQIIKLELELELNSSLPGFKNIPIVLFAVVKGVVGATTVPFVASTVPFVASTVPFVASTVPFVRLSRVFVGWLEELFEELLA